VLLRTSLNMKKQLLLGVSFLSLAAVAPAYAAPPSAPIYNWTGWYVGGNAGYSWGHADSTYNDPGFSNAGFGGLPTSFSGTEQLNGFIGGGQFGYNWQLGNAWVVGLETDFQYSAERGSRAFSTGYDCEGTCAINQTQSAKIDWFGTVRGRAGPIIDGPFANESLWLYVTGGLAYGRVSASGTVSDPTNCGCSWSYGGSGTNVGWTVGTGIEGAMFGSTHWTWKVEYLYIDLGSISGTGFETDYGSPFSWSARFTDNIIRFGINYRVP
jgi:outer membrane immunogenic protein